MFARTIGALGRAGVVALAVLTPTLLVRDMSYDPMYFVVFAAILAAGLTFVEYSSEFPSILSFRNAPPFNRLRFVCFFGTLLTLAMIAKNDIAETQMTHALSALGTIVGRALDFPFSPVRLFVLMMPQGADPSLLADMRTSAGLAYLLSVLGILGSLLLIRVFAWPTKTGAFNVWINLPLFDPTAGRDVLYRLKRDSTLYIAGGVLLPFLIPAVVKATSAVINPLILTEPETLIWTVTLWAVYPATMIMRGIAMGRVAEMIEEKRRRTYAKSSNAHLPASAP